MFLLFRIRVMSTWHQDSISLYSRWVLLYISEKREVGHHHRFQEDSEIEKSCILAQKSRNLKESLWIKLILIQGECQIAHFLFCSYNILNAIVYSSKFPFWVWFKMIKHVLGFFKTKVYESATCFFNQNLNQLTRMFF